MRLKAVLYYAGVGAAVAAALVVTLRLWERRLEVPFSYEGDGLFFAVLAKATAQDGLLHFRHLGMPFGTEIADWGAGMLFEFGVQRLLMAAFAEPGAAVNLYWLLLTVVTGATAAFAFRSLGLGPFLAFGLGYLYALSPFTFYRHVGHLSLVFQFVPLIALLMLRTAEGCPERLGTGVRLVILAAFLFQGMSYPYYAFFSCILLAAASVLGWMQTRRLATVKLASAAVLVIVIGTAASLAPSALYWHEHGKNPDLGYKTVAETDAFGLKIRHLLLPIPDHPLAPFRDLASAAATAGFPLENENTLVRLGTVASLGFLGLLACALGATAGVFRSLPSPLKAAASLNLIALLVAQVGGFGSFFSLLISPDIRAYSRIVVFIAFFSLLGAGFAMTHIGANVAARGWARTGVLRGGGLALLILAVFDQASTTGLRLVYAETSRRFAADREFVTRIESLLPTGSMVYQLPHTGIPLERNLTKMSTYDHGHAYLHSRALRWSWGAIVGRNGNWQAEVQNLSPRALVRTLALAGFSGVWLDRFGYEPSLGRERNEATVRSSPEAAIIQAAGEPPEMSRDGRYVFVGLETARRRLVAELGPSGVARDKERVLRPPIVPRYREGFGEEEGDGTRVWRTCGARGRIVIMNPVDREREVLLTGRFFPEGSGPRTIEILSQQFQDVVAVVSDGVTYERRAFLPARRRLQLQFSCLERPAGVVTPCFRITDFQVVDLGHPPEIAAPVDNAMDEEK